VIGDFSMIPVVEIPAEPAIAPSRQTEEGTGNTVNLPTPTPQPQVDATPIATLRAPASGATPIGESTNGAGGAETPTSAAPVEATPAPEETPVSAPVTATATLTATAAVTEGLPATATALLTDSAATEAPAEEAPASVAPAAPATGAALPAGVEPPPSGFALVVTDGVRLRVRDLPNTESLIVGYAYPGETFRVLQVSEDGAWTQINGSALSKENAAGGWVASDFLYVSP
jgi:hypothetical protein